MTLTFNHELNVSIQKGDSLYASLVTPSNLGGTNIPIGSTHDTKPFLIGVVKSVDRSNNTVKFTPVGGMPTITNMHYLFFSKDPIVNTSGIIGYFAETEYKNFSSSKAEIFATAVDYVESSK